LSLLTKPHNKHNYIEANQTIRSTQKL